jgi:CBS domain-containing protein
MKARDLLTRHVAVAHREDTLLEAAQRMREEHVGALVVVEVREGVRVPVGVLTDRDIVVGVVAKAATHLGDVTVGDVMSTELVTATTEEDLFVIARRMRSYGVRRMPVTNERGALEGVLSVDDIVGGLSQELAEAATLLSWQRHREPARRP